MTFTPTLDNDLRASALLRLANTLRDAGITTGFVLRTVPFGPVTVPDGGDRRVVQIVKGGRVVRAFTPEQVLHAKPRVLLHMVSL